jgi:hypothetical protein
MAQIKSFKDACKMLKLDPVKVLPKVTGVPKKHQQSIIAYAMLIIITEAANEGWKPNWKDSNEWKYCPWFDLSSGSGLSYDDYDNLHSYSYVGSRLCFKSRELCDYHAKKFIKLYKDYFLLS